MIKFQFKFPSWKDLLKWVLIIGSVMFVVCYGWQVLQILIEGHIEERRVDTIVGLILVVSLLLNIVFIDSIIRTIRMCSMSQANVTEINKEQFDALMDGEEVPWTAAFDHFQQMNTILANLRIIDTVLSNTIINESGGETDTKKFDSIKCFAAYIKSMNDVNINYINIITDNKRTKEFSAMISNETCKNSEQLEPTIVSGRYTGEIDEHDYSKLICKLSDGEEKDFYFCASNPMPKLYVIQGLTWDELRGLCIGMQRMAIDEYITISKGEVDRA